MPRLVADIAHRKKTSDGELSRLIRIFSYTTGPSEVLVPFSTFSKCLLHPDELAKLKHLIRTTDTRIPFLPVSSPSANPFVVYTDWLHLLLLCRDHQERGLLNGNDFDSFPELLSRYHMQYLTLSNYPVSKPFLPTTKVKDSLQSKEVEKSETKPSQSSKIFGLSYLKRRRWKINAPSLPVPKATIPKDGVNCRSQWSGRSRHQYFRKRSLLVHERDGDK